MTLKIFAVMGRELSLEYMQHRKNFADATEEEIAEYFCKTGSKRESCTELNLQAFEAIADFSDVRAAQEHFVQIADQVLQ